MTPIDDGIPLLKNPGPEYFATCEISCGRCGELMLFGADDLFAVHANTGLPECKKKTEQERKDG